MSVESVAVVGCGRMGTGVAEAVASVGIPVVAVKATGGDLSKVRDAIARSLERRVQKGKLDPAERDAIRGRIEVSGDLGRVEGCDLVIESGLEELTPKTHLLQQIEQRMSPGAILATNTSSLPLETLADRLQRPDQFLALHFFNPAQAMKLVELAATELTAPGVVEAAHSFCQAIHKHAVDVGPSSGYVVNRLLVPYLLHAIETLEQGVASADAIDDAMKLGCGHPMGPLALADYIGLDVVFAMAKTMQTELHDARYRAPSLLRRLVLARQLGKKTGAGIYDYSRETPRVNSAIRLQPRRTTVEVAAHAEPAE
ncbi:MAG: 3-hydroxyacyl-CoA dehydrogenase family protein [Polyangiales bacterium]